jgi:4-alpha-glucanotransferase
VAGLSVIPLQDVIGLGSEARMNTPSKNGGNWRWRLRPGMLTRDLAEKLAALAEVTDRLPEAIAAPPSEEFFA